MATPVPKESRYHCNSCKTSFSVTAKTLFHKTKVDLQKWFFAIPLIVNDTISIRELAKKIEVAKDTANHMITQVRLAYKDEPELISHFLKISI
jgi:transposase-like protein